MDTPAISILMPCYNRAYDLERVLRAYDAQVVEEPFELIAVDDGSKDDTYAVLTGYQPRHYALRVERQERNAGPAAARNRAIDLARAPLVLIVGDDILPDPHLVRGHLAAHRRYPAPGDAILGKVGWPSDMPVNTLMTHIDGAGAQQFSYHFFKNEHEYDFRHLYTANVSLKLDFLRSDGKLFDTDFHYAAFEDAELAYRLSKRGLHIHYIEALYGAHYHYHTIWTFSTRQYRAGLMATIMLRKHPELRPLIAGRQWPWPAYHAGLLARTGRYPLQNAPSLEDKLLLLLSQHEWSADPQMPQTQLDALYLPVLKYYYYKGLIVGSFPQAEAQRMNAVLALRQLSKPPKVF